MANVILITPGSGIQNFDADELNSAMEALASGGELSPQQQAIANSIAAPTQGNVFAGGTPDTGTVKAVNREDPLIPLPQTLSADNSSSARDFQGFLAGLSPSQTGAAAGRPLPGAPTSSGTLSGLIDARNLQGLFAPLGGGGNAAPNAGGRLETLADPDRIKEVEELRLAVEKNNLEQERQNQILREQVRQGIIPSLARVTNRLGQPVVDLSKIGLTQQQVDQTRRRVTIKDLLPSRQPTVIGASRPPSIIAR